MAQNAPTQPKQQAAAPAPLKPPPTSDDRPYDNQIFRLAEILGTLHYLRELCGANEGQVWREHMKELMNSEGTNAMRRAKLVESFNRGYRDYSRTYRSCTQPALTAIQRFMDQATSITDALLAAEKEK
ncbi:MAG TPA: TIGR02301 family protein [Hyphomicrobiales bacterium]|nr:TIGR02301 family protein [Hyphomicrobiales bacterium]